MFFLCSLAGVLAVSARAQESPKELDLAVSGSTLWSFKNPTASVGFLPPPAKGGTYPGASFQYFWTKHLGISGEGAFRYHKAFYNNFQPYRPLFFDLNGVYTAPVGRKTVADGMAGVGLESLIFYNEFASCSSGCFSHVNSNHFMLHFGGGVRYYFWHNVFVRPEAHWYFIPNNFEFYSRNVFRAGASVGYTFGSRSQTPPAKQSPPVQKPVQK
jgi:hypothetical protein